MDLIWIFLKKEYINAICSIKDDITQTELMRGSNISFAGLYQILHKFEQINLIKRLRGGRKVKIVLTEKGQKVKDEILRLKENLNKLDLENEPTNTT